jgi:hypothetical protein
MRNVRSDGRQRRSERRTGYYRYYLEDHPILGPVLILLLGGMCIYSTIFSTLLREFLLPDDATQGTLDQFYTAMGWGVAFVIAAMFIAFVFLLINLVSASFRRVRRRRPVICPRCGLAEVRGQVQFEHRQVTDTGWELVTCSRCGQEWHRQV